MEQGGGRAGREVVSFDALFEPREDLYGFDERIALTWDGSEQARGCREPSKRGNGAPSEEL